LFVEKRQSIVEKRQHASIAQKSRFCIKKKNTFLRIKGNINFFLMKQKSLPCGIED